jgi:tetrahydromethanopterin S-methyltransferase subunit C
MAHGHGAPGGSKKVWIKPNHLAAIGVVSGLAGVYLGFFSPIVAAALAIPALVWAADAIRRVAGYGLGTGVPSIGNLSVGMGILAALVGLRYEPAVGLGFAAAWGLLYGIVIGRLKILEIPVFTRCVTELAAGASLAFMCLLSAAVGGYIPGFFEARLLPNLFVTGFVAVIFWASSLAIAHPFNACLGPAERQARTLRLAVGVAGIDVTLAGIAALGVSGVSPSLISPAVAAGIIVVGTLAWLGGYYLFIKISMREAAVTLWTGFPEEKK